MEWEDGAEPATKAYCLSHGRRYFWKLTDGGYRNRLRNKSYKDRSYSEVAQEAVYWTNAILRVDRGIKNKSPEVRLAWRKKVDAPMMEDLRTWLEMQLEKHPGKNDLSKAVN